ncbi:MAG: AAA family ATPase [Hyphomicrobiales bacterium]|nr:AAA family ATPase [Hyphomicrobiales bacterium]
MNRPLPASKQLADAALEYAKTFGLPVFPIAKPGAKAPPVKGWQQVATCDLKQIGKWITKGLNLGLAMGRPLPAGGYAVAVDLDVRGKDGITEFAKLIGGEPPRTLTAVTPSGGMHLVFATREPARNSASKIASGVDIRGEGGYIVAVGSTTDEGVYKFLDRAPIAGAPAALVGALNAAAATAKPVKLDAAIELDTPSALSAAEAYLEEAAPSIEGQGGNDRAYRTAARLRDLGISEWMASSMLLGAWNRRCEPEWSTEELDTICRNAYAYGQNSPGSKSAAVDFDVLTDADIDHIGANDNRAVERKAVLPGATLDLAALAGRPVPKREWLVEGLIPAKNVTLLYGDGGTGKSTLMMQLGAAVAAGRDWIGRPVTAARPKALILTAEDDRDELHRRLADIASFEGLSLSDLGGHLKAISLADHASGATLAATDRNDRLKATPLWDELVREIAAFRPSFVALDTLTDIFGGNENVRGQVRAFVALLRAAAIQYDAAVLALAHPSRAGLASQNEFTSAAGSSGSTHWNNSVRSRLYLNRGENADAMRRNPDRRLLTVMKANYGRAGGKIPLQWTNGIFLPEGGHNAESAREQAQDAERAFMNLLDAYSAEGRNIGDAPGRNYAPALFANDERSGMTDKWQLRDAMNRLFAKGKIEVVTDGPPSKRRSRIARVDAAAEDDAA